MGLISPLTDQERTVRCGGQAYGVLMIALGITNTNENN